jgi:hypothetical protein
VEQTKHIYQTPCLVRPEVACYIDPNFQSLIHFAAKYQDFRKCALANANAGGENVHRGLVLGAVLGAQAGADAIPDDLKKGLKHSAAIAKEIQAFVSSKILGKDSSPSSTNGSGGKSADL